MTPQHKLAMAEGRARSYLERRIRLMATRTLMDVAESRGLYARVRQRDGRLVIGPPELAEDSALATALLNRDDDVRYLLRKALK